MLTLNSAKTRVIAVGSRFIATTVCTGMPATLDCRAIPARRSEETNTQCMNIDPATGYVYIVLKNGDVYPTTVPQ